MITRRQAAPAALRSRTLPIEGGWFMSVIAATFLTLAQAPLKLELAEKTRSGGVHPPDQAFGVNRVFVQCDATSPRGGVLLFGVPIGFRIAS
jgi:hypothetical protein